MMALSPTAEERADALANDLLDRGMTPVLTREARAVIAEAIRSAAADTITSAAHCARAHSHHALWCGLLDAAGCDERTEMFGRRLAQRIEASIRQQPFSPRENSRPTAAPTEKTR